MPDRFRREKPRTPAALLRAGLRRYGMWPAVVVITLLSIASSALISSGISLGLFHDSMDLRAWTATLLTPAMIAPVMTSLILRLVLQLDNAHAQLHRLIHFDHLTEIYNRRYFMQALEFEVERARSGARFALAIVDVDDFKRINDQYGHPIGDLVLRQVAQACRASVRDTDVVARIGGEEFAFLFPNSPLDAANALAERLLVCIRALRIVVQGQPLSVSVSVGLTAMNSRDAELETALRLADKALYAAKAGGKNRLEILLPQAA